jgi:hypothetical protein
VVKLTYQRALSDLPSYVSLEEGERRYALLAISPQEWPELFLGADPKRIITRHISVISHHATSQADAQNETSPRSLARLGREAPQPISLEESAQPGHEWSWRREGPLTEPLIITRGAWEGALETEVEGRRLSLLTPAGSAQHRVQGAPFAQQQLSLLTSELKRLHDLYGASRKAFKGRTQEHVWCLTLPLTPSSRRLQLAEWGVVTLPEAWFYRTLKSPQSQSPGERSLALKTLLRSDLLHVGARGVWSQGVALWLARRVSLSAAKLPLERTQREALEHTLSLNPDLELSQANTPERAAQLIEMLSHWLTLRQGGTEKKASKQLNAHQLLNAAFTGDKAVVETLLSEAPAFEATLTSLLERAEVPEVGVTWAWSKATQELSLSLSTKGDLLPPLCMKLGVEGSAPYTLCIKPGRPVGGASSEHKISFPKKPLWLHPNHSQVGLYRWVISEEAFLKLLKASGLSPLEWGTLPEVASQLMSAGRISASAYLSSVDALTLQALTPSSLALLMSYLNRAVHEFASPQPSQEQDPVRQWASARLQGVMWSEERLQQPPLSHLIQLQLAEWEPVGPIYVKGALSAKERKAVRRALSETSSSDMIAGASSRAQLIELQYPLLITTRAGDEKLWSEVGQLFAVSEDDPVARLLALQALATFPPPALYQTLELLISSPKEIEEQEELEVEEQASGEGSTSSSNTSSNTSKTGESKSEEHEEHEEHEEQEDERLEPSLKSEETLTLIQGVRSLSSRRAAWRWLGERLTQSTPPLDFQRPSVQRALLQWGAASCDQAGLTLAQHATRAERGFSPVVAREARVTERTIQRCLKGQKAREEVLRWLKKRKR